MELRRSPTSLTVRGFALGSLPIAAGLLFTSGNVGAQEALRNAVQGDRNLATRIQQSGSEIDAPITLGPVRMTAGVRVGVEYTDNANQSGIDPHDDLIITPGVDFGLFYQVTDSSRLALGFGVGYRFYVNQSRPDQLDLTPNSNLAYDFRAGDALITLYDTFSYSSDALNQGDLVNRSNYGGINNAVGIRTIYSPEPMFVEGGVSHANFWSTKSDAFNDLTRGSEQAFLRVGQVIAENTRWGVETSGSYIHYDVPIRNNLYQLSAGPFVEWQITKAWTLSGRVGWSWTTFDNNGTLPAPDDISRPYVGLDVTHQFTENFRHTFSAVREVSTGVETQILETFTFNYGFNWKITDLFGFGAGAYYQIGEQPGALTTENYDYYGFNAGFPFSITKRFTTSLNYTYRNRTSNISTRNYDVNTVTLGLRYSF